MRRSRRSHPQPFANGALNKEAAKDSDLPPYVEGEKDIAHPQVGELDGRQLDGISELPSSESRQVVVGELDGGGSTAGGMNEVHGR